VRATRDAILLRAGEIGRVVAPVTMMVFGFERALTVLRANDLAGRVTTVCAFVAGIVTFFTGFQDTVAANRIGGLRLRAAARGVGHPGAASWVRWTRRAATPALILRPFACRC